MGCQMSIDTTGIREHVREATEGQCAVVAALVIALHEAGVLPQDKYTNTLHRLWISMPEGEAVGEAGAAIERVLDLLNETAVSRFSCGNIVQDQPVSASDRRPVGDEATAHTSHRGASEICSVVSRQGPVTSLDG